MKKKKRIIQQVNASCLSQQIFSHLGKVPGLDQYKTLMINCLPQGHSITPMVNWNLQLLDQKVGTLTNELADSPPALPNKLGYSPPAHSTSVAYDTFWGCHFIIFIETCFVQYCHFVAYFHHYLILVNPESFCIIRWDII